MSREKASRTPKVPRAIGPGWGRWLGRFFARVIWNTRIVGKERVPRAGAVIVAANHSGWADGPLMIGCTPRGTHILIKIEMFRSAIGWIFRLSGQIPVDRGNGRPALATALKVLEDGRVVGIFPEGSRGRGDGSNARAGVAWLAVHSGAPVVPVAMLGTRRTGESTGKIPGLRRRLHVEFGAPVVVTGIEGMPKREAVAAAQAQLQRALADHVHAVEERTGLWLPTDHPAERGTPSAAGAADAQD
ncbi:lysophospholipid acyltransferase family protein [Actinotalea fermentans]|uniref:1-acyl-sn-glycerol-3-phosphate acyltransferase n=1 Tax=Actinotalea fermentans TaxID=43671 RepID=A0A511YUZ1_9CELL|nr:lysophospholipid acyltransferase family protein [Actinotalea fermentans]KGM17895.1 glycerol acyltransferase [Actinotalea fermentans ATCC 43279 = JCM 9966 = DSM 3133]GEN79009.1 1-acyl-sn-glycerol-3-phosphate acyltransferase [Actinotalea fermentans]